MHRLLYTATAVSLLVAAVSVITHSANDVIGTTTTAPARHYYLTKAAVAGNHALTSCATGYHFASFAELRDTSDLTYSKTLGRANADDGGGPPAGNAVGWIRTGFPAITDPSNTLNATNCNVWTSGNSTDSGEVLFFDPQLGQNNATSAFPTAGFLNNFQCDNTEGKNVGVWCIKN